MRKYLPQEFEQSWALKWDKEKVYAAQNSSDSSKKKFILDMFPYPSGAGLHVGHPRGFVASDIMARFYRMQGFNVLHPMGWDAFGLPAENAAIKAKRNPEEITKENIANFTRQLKMLGFSYDWDREISTANPSYYKWTQWLFIQLFKMGLLYKKLTPVFYCPFCKTGIAQEEVLANNTHERCQNTIEIRDLPQWIFRITTYADRLVDELDGLNWPEGILQMQRNWIGRKIGMKIKHTVVELNIEFETFTAYPAWSWADTFVVIAPNHPLVKELISGTEQEEKVKTFLTEYQTITEEQRQTDKFEKKGVFTGRYAKDPFGGADMPIWLANFALMNFGTGIIRCSAHDARDYEFAQKYNIPLKEVVDRVTPDVPANAHNNAGILRNSGVFTGKNVADIVEEAFAYIEKQGIGVPYKTFHIRDWIFSRQRYWGEPIPMVYCAACADKNTSYWSTDAGRQFQKQHQKVSKVNKEVQENLRGWFPLDQESLPLELPYLESYEPNESGQSPLAKIDSWISTLCPHCGEPAQRESDTMPNWAGSCWYFLRFADPKNDKEPWSQESLKMQPVDLYIGGAEHAVLHLLYARFWIKAFQDLGLLNFNEPFLGLRNQGMILAEDHRKMSKSWGNVINPDDVVREYGADALRVYEMFMAPINQEIAWSTRSLQGSYRFVKRIWDIFQAEKFFARSEAEEDTKLLSKLHKTIAKVSKDITDVKFNTAVASMMEFLNEWEKEADTHPRTLQKENAEKFLKIVAPFASFAAEEIWRTVLHKESSIHISAWPEIDTALLQDETISIPVQVNGKIRGVVTVPSENQSEEVLLIEAKKDEKIKQYIIGKTYKVIYVPGKILNLIVKI